MVNLAIITDSEMEVVSQPKLFPAWCHEHSKSPHQDHALTELVLLLYAYACMYCMPVQASILYSATDLKWVTLPLELILNSRRSQINIQV